jgi:hypothetical protein
MTTANSRSTGTGKGGGGHSDQCHRHGERAAALLEMTETRTEPGQNQDAQIEMTIRAFALFRTGEVFTFRAELGKRGLAGGLPTG